MKDVLKTLLTNVHILVIALLIVGLGLGIISSLPGKSKQPHSSQLNLSTDGSSTASPKDSTSSGSVSTAPNQPQNGGTTPNGSSSGTATPPNVDNPTTTPPSAGGHGTVTNPCIVWCDGSGAPCGSTCKSTPPISTPPSPGCGVCGGPVGIYGGVHPDYAVCPMYACPPTAD